MHFLVLLYPSNDLNMNNPIHNTSALEKTSKEDHTLVDRTTYTYTHVHIDSSNLLITFYFLYRSTALI